MAKQSFYAVKVGKTPGVYKTWNECKAQVEGFPNAAYKKFKSELEAQSFMNGDIQMDVESKDVVKKSKSVTNLHSIDLPDGPYAFVDGSFNPFLYFRF